MSPSPLRGRGRYDAGTGAPHMTITTTTAHRISLAAGLLLVVVVIYSALQPAMAVCGALDPTYQPIIAFELARSVADLHAIFGPAPGACREALRANFTVLNSGDNFLFIPLYGVFLVFFFLAARGRSPRLARMGAIFILVACAGDYIENACLLRIAANPDVQSAPLSLLPWATGVKWTLLGIAGAIGGLLLSRRGGWRWIVAGLCFAGAALVILAMIDPHRFGRFAANGVTISWIVFLIADAKAAWRAPARDVGIV